MSDYKGRLVSEKKYSPFGELISNVEMYYDLAGNVTKKEYHLQNEVVTTLYDYDACHRLINQINGAGAPEQIITTFLYNHFGELSETQYADGTSKSYLYDGIGRLSEEYSNDKTVHYRYSYDMQDNPIFVKNVVTGKNTII